MHPKTHDEAILPYPPLQWTTLYDFHIQKNKDRDVLYSQGFKETYCSYEIVSQLLSCRRYI